MLRLVHFKRLARVAAPVLLALASGLGAAAAFAAGLPAEAATAAGPAVAASAPMNANAYYRQERKKVSERYWLRDSAPPEQTNPGTPQLSRDPKVIEQGRRLYVEGVRANGQPLAALRLDGQIKLSGAEAACVLCHRASGLGAVEGTSQIQPVTGRFLFDQDRRALVNMNVRTRKAFNRRHEPYTLATLAQAMREGRHQSGRIMEPLMPLYELSDGEVFALASYLRRLSNDWSPGVSDYRVRIAAVVTPDADPDRKRIFAETARAIVEQKNGNILAGGQRNMANMSSGMEMVLRTERTWDFDLWELKGPASTWPDQLARFYKANPPFALVSGLGGANWEPVHQFCERQAVPCWFPSVGAVPNAGAQDFYSVYFSRGAGLEADVLAMQLAGKGRPSRLLQVYADAGVANGAVAALRARLAGSAVQTSEFQWSGKAAELAAQLAALGEGDSVVFWLTPTELQAALSSVKPGLATPYFSASIGGGDKLPLAGEWRAQARVLYPYQLPEARRRGLTYFTEWLRIRGLPAQDEVLQSEIYFAFSYFHDTMVDLLDNVNRDYLLERGENMLSWREAAKAEDEARELSLPRTDKADAGLQPLRDMPARPMTPRPVPRSAKAMAAAASAAAAADGKGLGPLLAGGGASAANTRHGSADFVRGHPMEEMDAVPGNSAMPGAAEGTTVYPRLSLGQRQRHASKGAYVVRFDEQARGGWRVESDWVTP